MSKLSCIKYGFRSFSRGPSYHNDYLKSLVEFQAVSLKSPEEIQAAIKIISVSFQIQVIITVI